MGKLRISMDEQSGKLNVDRVPPARDGETRDRPRKNNGNATSATASDLTARTPLGWMAGRTDRLRRTPSVRTLLDEDRLMTTDDRIFYGPHECRDCGTLVCKASHHQGGESYDYPDGPIYPNTEWHRHKCTMSKHPAPPEGPLPNV